MAQAVKLVVLAEYRCRDLYYPSGAVIDVPPDLADFLMRDAPGVFEPWQPPAKALDEPPADKAIKAAPRKK